MDTGQETVSPLPTASLSLGQRLLYASAHFGVAVMAFTVTTWIIYFYGGSPERGLSARVDGSLLAIALLMGRLVDACTDPLVGFWSDRTRTRWGRRKPFIAFGLLPLTLSFALLWWTPAAEVTLLNFVYLSVILFGFFLSFTVVVVPYLALLPEIAHGDRERVDLAALQAVFNVLGNLAGVVAGGWLITRIGFSGMGIALGVVSALTYVLALLGPKETHRVETGEAALGVRQALGYTLGNKAFLRFGGGFLPFWIGLSVVLASMPLITTELLGRTETQAGLLIGMALITAVLCFPLISRLAVSRGKRWVFLASMTWFCLVMPLVGTVGLWPLPLAGFWQAAVLMVLAGPAIGGLFVVPYAILADITDEDERVTGRRREAMYFGVHGFLYKAGMGLGAACAALLFRFLGATSVHPWGLYLSGVFAAVFTAIGLMVFWGYRLSKIGDSPGVPLADAGGS